MFGLGPMEMLIVGVIAVLLFGKRLPEVGRSLGKGLLEFKKEMHDIQNDVDTAVNSRSQVAYQPEAEDYEQSTAPKFEPPAREPHETPVRDPHSQSTEV